MKTNYEDLEGKEVKVFRRRGMPDVFDVGIVAGCEYSVGITVVLKENKKDEISCLNRKVHTVSTPKARYRKAFQEMVKQIQDGEVTNTLISGELLGHPVSTMWEGNGAPCAFK